MKTMSYWLLVLAYVFVNSGKPVVNNLQLMSVRRLQYYVYLDAIIKRLHSEILLLMVAKRT